VRVISAIFGSCATGLAPAARSYVKRIISLFAVLGLVGCFLPLMPGVSLFDLRHFDGSWHVWIILAAFALPAYAGMAATESERIAALVGTAAFGYLTYTFGTGVYDLVVHASLGGMMMGVAVIGGLFTSVLGLLATERS
jgi:hypothetical protein